MGPAPNESWPLELRADERAANQPALAASDVLANHGRFRRFSGGSGAGPEGTGMGSSQAGPTSDTAGRNTGLAGTSSSSDPAEPRAR